jgi:hypothetical protein
MALCSNRFGGHLQHTAFQDEDPRFRHNIKSNDCSRTQDHRTQHMKPHYNHRSKILRSIAWRCAWCDRRGLRKPLPKAMFKPGQLSAIQQPQKAQLSLLPWRNWLARSTVRFGYRQIGYREVDSSSLSGRALFLYFSCRNNGLQRGTATSWAMHLLLMLPNSQIHRLAALKEMRILYCICGWPTIPGLNRPSCRGGDPAPSSHWCWNGIYGPRIRATRSHFGELTCMVGFIWVVVIIMIIIGHAMASVWEVNYWYNVFDDRTSAYV